MCGIAGHVAPERAQALEQTVGIMVDVLKRRGPDSAGLKTWPGATLGHRRLAILDLSPAGHQPMLSDDGEIGLVFNGCLYNFGELREELEKRGHTFRSHSDTEVLLRGYQEWGIDALVGRSRGMFAFAIWDQRRRTLTLARDRLGVKPLIYCIGDGEIGFASTIAALRTAGFGGEIDPQAVLDFLEFGYVTEDRAVYGGMCKLPPATILEWCDGRVTERQYWSLPETGAASRISFHEAVEETERLLVESVRLRLCADVPIGVLLSAGIDSTLVCWSLRELNANIKAFTVRAAGDPSDESAGAARTAQLLGIPHEIVDMPAARCSLDELTDAYSEPFGAESALAMLWVSRAVKRRATVLLTGDGGDDIFFGYPFFRNAWMAQRFARHLPAAAAGAWRAAGNYLPGYGPIRRAKNFLNYAAGGLGAHARAHDGLPYYDHRGMLGERFAGKSLSQRRIPESLVSARRLLSDVFAYHRRMHFTGEFMPKVDGATMYYGIEARAPFLDQKIWEFGATLPPEVRFHGGMLKAILREIVRRRLGPEVAFRKKQGFTVPVERLLAEKWSDMLDPLREGTVLERDGWLRRGSLQAPIRDAESRRWVPIQVWRLLVLEHWFERNGRRRASGSNDCAVPAAPSRRRRCRSSLPGRSRRSG
jgi:asparagine synthase (glutamine-hydrolysing)